MKKSISLYTRFTKTYTHQYIKTQWNNAAIFGIWPRKKQKIDAHVCDTSNINLIADSVIFALHKRRREPRMPTKSLLLLKISIGLAIIFLQQFATR